MYRLTCLFVSLARSLGRSLNTAYQSRVQTHSASHGKWAATCDYQQCGVLTSVDSDEPMQPPFKLRNSQWCSISSLTLIKYFGDYQRLWSDCAYAQADLRLCLSHIPHCWKSHVAAQMFKKLYYPNITTRLIKHSVWALYIWAQLLKSVTCLVWNPVFATWPWVPLKNS